MGSNSRKRHVPSTMNRRDLLKTLLIGAAAAVITGCDDDTPLAAQAEPLPSEEAASTPISPTVPPGYEPAPAGIAVYSLVPAVNPPEYAASGGSLAGFSDAELLDARNLQLLRLYQYTEGTEGVPQYWNDEQAFGTAMQAFFEQHPAISVKQVQAGDGSLLTALIEDMGDGASAVYYGFNGQGALAYAEPHFDNHDTVLEPVFVPGGLTPEFVKNLDDGHWYLYAVDESTGEARYWFNTYNTTAENIGEQWFEMYNNQSVKTWDGEQWVDRPLCDMVAVPKEYEGLYEPETVMITDTKGKQRAVKIKSLTPEEVALGKVPMERLLEFNGNEWVPYVPEYIPLFPEEDYRLVDPETLVMPTQITRMHFGDDLSQPEIPFGYLGAVKDNDNASYKYELYSGIFVDAFPLEDYQSSIVVFSVLMPTGNNALIAFALSNIPHDDAILKTVDTITEIGFDGTETWAKLGIRNSKTGDLPVDTPTVSSYFEKHRDELVGQQMIFSLPYNQIKVAYPKYADITQVLTGGSDLSILDKYDHIVVNAYGIVLPYDMVQELVAGR